MILLHLDDTIFPTKSMNPRIFNFAISIVEEHYVLSNSAIKTEEKYRGW